MDFRKLKLLKANHRFYDIDRIIVNKLTIQFWICTLNLVGDGKSKANVENDTQRLKERKLNK